MPTKNDIYAQLIKIGIQKGYEVIPEFRINLPDGRKKNIDLVWCIRNNLTSKFQNQPSKEYWSIVAAFEIEGSNVRLKKELHRHITDFPHVSNVDPICSPQKFVVLYTEAYDRTWKNARNADAEIEVRKNWAKPQTANFSVEDGRDLVWTEKIPAASEISRG